MWGGWPTYTLTHTKSKTPKCSNKQTQFTLLLSVRKINLSRCFSLSLFCLKKRIVSKRNIHVQKAKRETLACWFDVFDFFSIFSCSLPSIRPRVYIQRNKRAKKTRKNQMCAQYTWKPLVERRVHIETNKHITRCMFISSETTNKNKNG